ncbi:MAG: hypothetical protein A3F67_00245 [Verrucomicrobia bacterium RIFCSPHIGHO2_12_FULL_41_10]|nr:MAG: hypothetical protein A3F67_00245 [Verrucomicrobia bacterium RIFCSPHIGHO2_12_FULL_41_10]HLB33634.1 HRDC domain-containing protein [Chthoniobacterales bacterium]
MIAEHSSFNDLLGHLASQSTVALDTEADSLHCYFEKLCLIQLGSDQQFHLMDPLAGLPLEKLFTALNGKRLIFHDADYDLRLLRRSGEFPDNDIFDTMIAARLCGEPHLGLSALVEKYFHVTLSKASRKANWGLRPLSSQMVTYAINDVRYLFDLADILNERLEEFERMEWFYQSRDRMLRATRGTKTRDEDSLWRLSGYSKLPPQSWAVLKALWLWRDAEARQWDKPAFYIMSNHELLQAAEFAPLEKSFKRPRLTQTVLQRFEEVLAEALALSEESWPQPLLSVRTHVTKQERDRFKKLKDHRDRVAYDLNLDPSIIASNSAMEITVRNPEVPVLLPWQQSLLGLD